MKKTLQVLLMCGAAWPAMAMDRSVQVRPAPWPTGVARPSLVENETLPPADREVGSVAVFLTTRPILGRPDLDVARPDLKARLPCVVTMEGKPGPAAQHMLGELARLNVPAVWFVQNAVPADKAILSEAKRVGVELGAMPLSGRVLSGRPESEQVFEIEGGVTELRDAGAETWLVRPPGASNDAGTLKAAAQLGVTLVAWTVDGGRADLTTPAAIAAEVGRQSGPGDVVRLPVSTAAGVALPAVVGRLAQKGCRFDNLSGWLEAAGAFSND